MTAYTVGEIENNVAKIIFSDGSWSYVELSDDMTEAQLDDYVNAITPIHLKTGAGTPSFLQTGQSRTAAAALSVNPDWLQARLDAYGTVDSQIEYIAENGLAAWQSHVADIKAANPKPE
tara:strand:+ start:1428 stop:1784 length:357 start_codon:yes stop_codon:yes gene_type:complete